MMVQE